MSEQYLTEGAEDVPADPATDCVEVGSATSAEAWDNGDAVYDPGEDQVLDRHDDPRFIRWIDRRMGPIRRHPVMGPAWRLVVVVIGATLVLGGLAMVFIPGPGWATVLLGVAVLATEFVWARRVLRFGNHHVGRWTRWMKRQPAWLRGAVGVIAALGLASIVVSLLYFIGNIDVPEELGLPGFRRGMHWLGLRPKPPRR